MYTQKYKTANKISSTSSNFDYGAFELVSQVRVVGSE